MTQHTTQFRADPSYTASEGQFDLTELLYARSDAGGLIQACNAAFRCVSAHDWSAPIGAPQGMTRHPDMPAGACRLIRDRLGAGHPTAAYVKNRSRSGRPYWVFALIAPVEGGEIAILLKPSSDLFATVSGLYAEQREHENIEWLRPDQSAERLETTIRAQGFSDYAAFQGHAIADEVAARAGQMGRGIDPLHRRFTEMSGAVWQLQVEIVELLEDIRAIGAAPVTMGLQAKRQEEEGTLVAAMAVKDISSWLHTFIVGESSAFARIRGAILRGQFYSFATALQREMIEKLHRDPALWPAAFDVKIEIENLTLHRDRFARQIACALDGVELDADRFVRGILAMKRCVAGLGTPRRISETGTAPLSRAGPPSSASPARFEPGRTTMEQRLTRLVELTAVIQRNTSMLHAML